MIRFCNWKIACDGPLLAMQYDNLTRELRVAGNLPEGYDWAALVQVNRYFDIIALDRTADGAAAVLTAEQLSQSGYYTVQLRGTQGEKVRHTNTIRVAVGRSLSGDEHWPEIPSEFTQLEQRVYEAMHNAASSETVASNSAAEAKTSAEAAAKSAEEAAKSAEEAAKNANRKIHWDDLEGRPFGDNVPFVVLEDTTIETDGLFGDVVDVEISLEPGKSYTVTWNGVAYECICYESDGEILLGNGQGVWAEDTGEPFLIHWHPEFKSLSVEVIDGSVSVTLSISTKVLKTLDNKYLGILEKTSSDTLTWPGDTEGRVSSSDGQFYKVSDAIVREEDTVNGATVVVNGQELTIPGGAQMVVPGVFVHIADDYPDFPDVVYYVQEEAVGVDVAGFSFPEAGVYFRYEGGPVSSLTLPGYTGFVEEKIERKYLPDSLFTGDQSASVGGAAALELLAESGVLIPAYENGTFYTDAGTTVYIL